MDTFKALISGITDEYDELKTTVDNSSGSLETMYELMANTTAGKMETFTSELETVGIMIGDIIIPHLIKFLEKVSAVLQKFKEMSPEMQENIVKWGAIALAIGPVITILGTFVGATGNIVKAFGSMSGAMAKLITKAGSTAIATSATSASVASSTTAIATSTSGLAGALTKLGPALTNPWVLLGAAVVGGTALVIHENKKLEEFTKDAVEKTRQHVANLEEDYTEAMTSITNSITTLTGKDITFISEKDKILLQKDLKDIEEIINGGSGNAEKEMREYINRIVRLLPEMPEEMQQSTALGIKQMIEVLGKDGKLGSDAVKTAEELWNLINEKLSKPIDGPDFSNMRTSIEMQQKYMDLTEELATAKGWGGFSKIAGDWDEASAYINKFIKSSKGLKAEDLPAFMDNLASAMENSGMKADSMEYALSKSMTTAINTFGPKGAVMYFEEFIEKTGLGSDALKGTLEQMAYSYQWLTDEQKRNFDIAYADMLSHYGYIDEMTMGFNEGMLSQNSEMWSGIVSQYLLGTENAKAQVQAFVEDAVGNIAYMSAENQIKSVEWMSTYLQKMVETGILTKDEAQAMADNINSQLNKEVTTKVRLDKTQFEQDSSQTEQKVSKIDSSTASPKFMTAKEKFEQDALAIQTKLEELDKKEIAPKIDADTIQADLNITNFRNNLNLIPSTKTVTIKTVEQKVSTSTPVVGPIRKSIDIDNSPVLQNARAFASLASETFDVNLGNVTTDYQISGGYYSRKTSEPIVNPSSNIEKAIIKVLESMKEQGKSFTQNITINSPQELSPRQIARETRLAGQKLIRLY